MSETPFSPLIADIITASFSMTADTSQRLIDSLTKQAADLEAEVAAIRDGVLCLLAGDFQPTSAAIERALYPSAERVDLYREEGQS